MHLVLSRCVLFLCRHQFHSVCCMCHVCSHVWSLRCGNAAISLENVSSVKKATKVTHSSLYMHIPIPVDDRGCELTQAVPAGAAVSLGCQPPDCPGAILLCFFLLHVKACVALRLLSGRSIRSRCLSHMSQFSKTQREKMGYHTDTVDLQAQRVSQAPTQPLLFLAWGHSEQWHNLWREVQGLGLELTELP